MSISIIDIFFVTLAYYALRMTTVKGVNFSFTSIWMLRFSATLMLISVAIMDKYYIIGSNQVPLIGATGFLFYGTALGIQGYIVTSNIEKGGNDLKSKPMYTWDMVVIGIIATLWITILIATK